MVSPKKYKKFKIADMINIANVKVAVYKISKDGPLHGIDKLEQLAQED